MQGLKQSKITDFLRKIKTFSLNAYGELKIFTGYYFFDIILLL